MSDDNVIPIPTPANEAETMSLPPMPPHFWVSGWDWMPQVMGQTPPIPPGQAMTVFVSLSRPSAERHPESFLAMPELEHQIYLRLNRAEVWKAAIELLKEVGMDPNSFILQAHKRGRAEFETI